MRWHGGGLGVVSDNGTVLIVMAGLPGSDNSAVAGEVARACPPRGEN